MRANIHPEYRKVIFHDTNADAYFEVGSTIETKDTIEWQGDTLPLVKLDVSSASHPFYTGQQRAVSSEGRAAQFKRRFGSLGSRKG